MLVGSAGDFCPEDRALKLLVGEMSDPGLRNPESSDQIDSGDWIELVTLPSLESDLEVPGRTTVLSWMEYSGLDAVAPSRSEVGWRSSFAMSCVVSIASDRHHRS